MSGEQSKKLRQYTCVPCRGDEPALSPDQWGSYLPEIPEWQVDTSGEVPKLTRVYRLKNFRQALNFAQAVGDSAEEQDHHPRLIVEWGRVEAQWWTHKIHGLHQNDFIMAARSDAIYQKLVERQETG